MKKLIATTAAALLAAATVSAGEGLKVSGFVRGGISGDLSDMTADATYGETGTVIGTTYLLGTNWGASSDSQLNANYDGENGGVMFRFQHNLTDTNNFGMGDVRSAMAYANFFDGAVIVEGGKLVDRFTAADDDIGFAFDKINGDVNTLGTRLVIRPIEGLYLTVAGTDFNPEYYEYDEKYTKKGNADYDAKKARRNGNPKFGAKLLSVSAKYDSEMFAVAGGVHFSGIFYGSFAYKGIENLTLAAGLLGDYADHWDSENKKMVDADDDTKYLATDVVLEYSADPVLFGVIGYVYIADDKYFADGEGDPWLSTVTPYLQYKLSDIVTLQAESTLYVPEAWDEKKYGDRKDMYVTVTPAVVFNASENALVNVWLHVSTDTDQEHHATGVSVKYTF